VSRAGAWRTIVLGALLSCGVESAQFVIPGRDPSLSDVLFNTLGTALGAALAYFAPAMWRPTRRQAGVLSIVGALGAASVITLTGVLLAPSFPDDVYYGGWTPRFGHLEWYGGRVLQASVDGLNIPAGVLGNSPQVRHELLVDSAIHVVARAGPRPQELAPLFTIDDQHQREIFLLGIDGDDIVFRYRTRAVDWGLIGPEIRAWHAVRGIAWRQPLAVIVRPAGNGHCIGVNGSEQCTLGYTVGTGWALALGNQPVPLWLRPILNVIWLVGLFFPIGLWARFGWPFATAVALSLASLLLLPAFLGLVPTPQAELSGAFAADARDHLDGICLEHVYVANGLIEALGDRVVAIVLESKTLVSWKCPPRWHEVYDKSYWTPLPVDQWHNAPSGALRMALRPEPGWNGTNSSIGPCSNRCCGNVSRFDVPQGCSLVGGQPASGDSFRSRVHDSSWRGMIVSPRLSPSSAWAARGAA